MHRMIELLLTDLHHTLADLGNDEGLIGPSLYDTAQVIRLAPSGKIQPTLEWLREQQQPDGGWGTQPTPRTRDVPTLAAMLALHKHSRRAHDRAAIDAGVAFLRRQKSDWECDLPNDLPVGVELLLPALLADAQQAKLDIDLAPYARITALGRLRYKQIAAIRPGAGTTPIHSWEAWGCEPDPALQDRYGGLGHSPAATAAWLHAATDRPQLADARAAAQGYLAAANHATGIDLPNIMPTVWPIPYFEQAFALYPLLMAGVFTHPALAAAVTAQLLALQHAMRPKGIGMSDAFLHDGDITATTTLLLAIAGRHPDADVVRSFAHPETGMFITYPHEIQPSLSTSIHAAHALAQLNDLPKATIEALINQKQPDGRWAGDKWHCSWLYPTSHIMCLMLDIGRPDLASAPLGAILDSQNADGSWMGEQATLEGTAHGALALLMLDRHGKLPAAGQQALHRATRWMLQHYQAGAEETAALWVGKELYRPRRVARAYELSAMLGGVLQGYGI